MRLTPFALLPFVFPTLSFATPIVLDDYSSDANFLAGNYQLIDVFAGFREPDENGNPPGPFVTNHVAIQDGNFNINTAWTAGWMWMGGH